MGGFFESLNNSIFFAINNGWHGAGGDLIIGNATYLGNGWVTYIAAIVAITALDREHFKRDFLILLGLALGEGLVLQLLKSSFDSPRPLAAFHDGIANGSVVVNLMFEPLYSRAFPSGHTQTAFCVALFVNWLLGKSRITKPRLVFLQAAMIVLAVLVGISRIYVGAHFPVDVLGGAIIGIVPVLVVTRLVDRRAVRSPV